jgi:hypothetical protein
MIKEARMEDIKRFIIMIIICSSIGLNIGLCIALHKANKTIEKISHIQEQRVIK